MLKRTVLLVVIVFIFGSCVSRTKMAYFQNISDVTSEKTFEPTLQADDKLLITINAPVPNQDLAAPFNPTAIVTEGADGASGTGSTGVDYLIDNDGYIILPVIGKIKLGGLTRTEALEKLNSEISRYFDDPIISLRIINFKVTILGDVRVPGSYTIGSERLTLPEALGLAGDLTITGRRDNIMIIREVEGKRTYNFVDITKADFMNTEYYYLAQNDLIVVEPNKTQMNSSVIGGEVTLAIAAVTLVISLANFLTR